MGKIEDVEILRQSWGPTKEEVCVTYHFLSNMSISFVYTTLYIVDNLVDNMAKKWISIG